MDFYESNLENGSRDQQNYIIVFVLVGTVPVGMVPYWNNIYKWINNY